MAVADIRIKKSLRYSVLDGTFAASMIGFGESFFMAFAILLGATNIQIAVLGALPHTLGSFSQLFSERLIRAFRSRKRLVTTGSLMQALVFIPISAVVLLGSARIFSLILFLCLFRVFGMVIGPAWNSWMGDLTDERERGRYFGRRNKITGFSSFASFFLAGYILHGFSDGFDSEYTGFVLIFALAFFSRLVSFSYLSKKYEPFYEVTEEKVEGLVEFVRKSSSNNWGLFYLYLGIMNFSVWVSAPFFTPYMLKDLELGYLAYTFITASAIVVKFLSMPVWGRAVDQYGARKVLSLAGFLMPVVPLLWSFSTDVVYLIVVEAYSGLIWGAFEIAAFTFVFDTTEPRKRVAFIGYSNVINGAAVLAGAMAGGIIVKYNSLFWSNYLIVFVLSFVLRLSASMVFIPRIREVRIVEEIPYTRLFLKVISVMPTMGLIYGLVPFAKKDRDEA